jgi:hypothetical protein
MGKMGKKIGHYNSEKEMMRGSEGGNSYKYIWERTSYQSWSQAISWTDRTYKQTMPQTPQMSR